MFFAFSRWLAACFIAWHQLSTTSVAAEKLLIVIASSPVCAKCCPTDIGPLNRDVISADACLLPHCQMYTASCCSRQHSITLSKDDEIERRSVHDMGFTYLSLDRRHTSADRSGAGLSASPGENYCISLVSLTPCVKRLIEDARQ